MPVALPVSAHAQRKRERRKSRNREGIVDEQKEQDRIRRRAYEIWEREGSPNGRAEEFWQQAQASIEAEDGPDQSGREAEAHGDATIK